MDRQKHLEEILEIEDCEVREEESYYYDDEFIESLGIENISASEVSVINKNLWNDTLKG